MSGAAWLESALSEWAKRTMLSLHCCHSSATHLIKWFALVESVDAFANESNFFQLKFDLLNAVLSILFLEDSQIGAQNRRAKIDSI